MRLRGIYVAPDDSATITPIGGTTDIDAAVVPELDFTYFLSENIAAELILGTTKHDVAATGTTLGNVDLGSVWLLPPTLTLQYHFTGNEGVKPYIGAGINYTIFYNVDDPAGLSLDYDNSFGYALQFGVDFAAGENAFWNIDVKKLFLSTDVSINGGAITADVDIDPWIIGIGYGWRF